MYVKQLIHFFTNSARSQKLIVLVFVLGIVCWAATMVRSGLCWQAQCVGGVGFWGANGHDGIWHIALSESILNSSLGMPVFSGNPLQNYHVGFDVLVAILARVTSIQVPVIYFQILPIIFAATIGILSYLFVSRLTQSRLAIWLALFFVYFGSGLGWIIELGRTHQLGGESMFWSSQSISTLINPPFALSLILMLIALILLTQVTTKWSTKKAICTALVFGLLFEIKAYAGLLALFALAVASVVRFATAKRSDIAKIFGLALVTFLLLFSALNNGSQDLVVYQPFWFIETMMGLSDRLGWDKFYSAMTSYRSGNQYLKFIVSYAGALGIFIVGNLGMRIVAVLALNKSSVRELMRKPVMVIMVSVIAAGIVTPTFFLQKGTPWNTIQFFYYTQFFTGLIAALTLGKLLSRVSDRIKVGVVVLVVAVTVPGTFATLMSVYIPPRPPAKITTEELSALHFLSSQPQGVVLTGLYDPLRARKAESNPPRSLYEYDSTAYVAAYAAKPVYLADEVNLDITGYDWRPRRQSVERFLSTLDQIEARAFLHDNNISYIYWVAGERAALGETQLGLTKIFENSIVNIYRVNYAQGY